MICIAFAYSFLLFSIRSLLFYPIDTRVRLAGVFCYLWARIIDRFLRISNFLILLCKPQITWTATQTFWLILFLFFLCPKLNFFNVADANKTIGTIKNFVLKRLSAVKEFLTTVIDNEWLFIYFKKKIQSKKEASSNSKRMKKYTYLVF